MTTKTLAKTATERDRVRTIKNEAAGLVRASVNVWVLAADKSDVQAAMRKAADKFVKRVHKNL